MIRILIVIGLIFIAKKAIYSSLAERQFLIGKSAAIYCSVSNTVLCLRSAEYMRKGVKLDPNEYIYKLELARILTRLYDIKRDKRLLAVAAPFCRKAMRHSWDKQYPYICLANVYFKAGNRKKALENLLKAQKYIPNNEKLKQYINIIK